MTGTELLEEIRTILREAQVSTVAQPWLYSDTDLIYAVRSAFRHLSSKGLVIEATMDVDGTLDPEISNDLGVLTALYVAQRLIRGDLIRRLGTGSLGTYFRSGPDVIDKRQAAETFRKTADVLLSEYETALVLALSAVMPGDTFGEQTLTDGDG